MELKDVKDLIMAVNNTDIESVEIQDGDFRLIINRSKSTGGLANPNIVQKEVKDSKVSELVEVVKEEASPRDENTYLVKSPMVGVYYEAASPESEPFVKLGSLVEKGQTLCIVEAMKIMNEIESEVAGEVVEVLVSDGDIIDYGQDLMRIRRM